MKGQRTRAKRGEGQPHQMPAKNQRPHLQAARPINAQVSTVPFGQPERRHEFCHRSDYAPVLLLPQRSQTHRKTRGHYVS